MTRREKLMAQYEDALFALIMDEVAEAEGRIAIEENQRLKESGEVEIPAEMSRRCKRTILRKTSENNIKRYGKGVGKVLNKVAIVALMAVFLFTTAFAASDSFRVKTLNFVMEVLMTAPRLDLCQRMSTSPITARRFPKLPPAGCRKDLN